MKRTNKDIIVSGINSEIYPIIRLTLLKNDKFFGIGIRDLLHEIDKNNSIQKSCQVTGMSYSKAWSIIKRAERELGFKILDTVVGGKGGGTSSLTKEGKLFLVTYDKMLAELDCYTNKIFKKYFGGKYA